MNNERISKISIWMTLLAILFIAVYPLFINYFFSKNVCALLFYLFYLILILNYLTLNKNEENYLSKIKWIGSNVNNLIINIIVIFLFGIIIVRSNINVGSAFLILFSSQVLLVITIVLLKRKILLILFWINFYLFMLTLISFQLPKIYFEFLSNVNPFGGLFIYLFG
jgi:hypothetical protein